VIELIRRLVAFLFPPQGAHRADTAPAVQPEPQRIQWPTVRPCAEPLHGEEVRLVRPYLVAFEREQERQRQRERRVAALMAAAGYDFPGTEYAA
jgi:hypothetical protein